MPLHCVERQIHSLNVCFVCFVFCLCPCPEANDGKCSAIFDCKSYYYRMSKKCGCTCCCCIGALFTFWWKSWIQQMMEILLQCPWKKWCCLFHTLPIEEVMLFVPRNAHRRSDVVCSMQCPWKKWCLFHASQGVTIIDSWSDVVCSMQCPIERSDVVCSMHAKDLQ